MSTNIIVAALAGLIFGGGSVYMLVGGGQPAPMVHTMDMTMDGMTSELEGKTGAEFERVFLDQMIIHHEGAVEMARMVLEKTQRPELLKLSNDIVAAQTSEITLMRQWEAEWFGHR